MARPALFLDRDGVINEDVAYCHRPQDCRFLPGIFDLVRRARVIGMAVVVVTNQAGIARGYYTEEQFHAFMDWMRSQFTAKGAPLDAVYFCPHHPTAGQGAYLRACGCRKPEPGMLIQAAQDLNLDLPASILVGDSLTDLEAARRAGIKYALLLAPATDGVEAYGGHGTVRRLDDIIPQIEGRTKP